MSNRIRTTLTVLAAATTILTLPVSSAAAQATPAALAIIAGRIVGLYGVPLSGAAVEAVSLQSRTSRRTTTDSAGHYTIIFNDSSLTFRVTVTASGYALFSADAERSPGDDRIAFNVKLRSDTTTRVITRPYDVARGGAIGGQASSGGDRAGQSAPFALVGTITDRQDKPIAAARVIVDAASATRGGPGLEPSQTATTDALGHFTLAFNGNARTYSVNVRADGFVPMTTTVEHRAGPTVTFDARLGVGAILIAGPAYPLTTVARSSLGSADAADFWIGGGDITVQGTDEDVVSYSSVVRDGGHAGDSTSEAFMRRDEYGTHLVAGYGVRLAGGPGVQLIVKVPRNLKALKLTVAHYGDIHVENFGGELSVIDERGSVELNAVSGPTIVEARNGQIKATIAQLPPSGTAGFDFLGRNGDITVTLPAAAIADFQLTAHGGAVKTDFQRGVGPTVRLVALNGNVVVTKAVGTSH